MSTHPLPPPAGGVAGFTRIGFGVPDLKRCQRIVDDLVSLAVDPAFVRVDQREAVLAILRTHGATWADYFALEDTPWLFAEPRQWISKLTQTRDLSTPDLYAALGHARASGSGC
jgi:hypothetical protein